jgi:hypothetical protein
MKGTLTMQREEQTDFNMRFSTNGNLGALMLETITTSEESGETYCVLVYHFSKIITYWILNGKCVGRCVYYPEQKLDDIVMLGEPKRARWVKSTDYPNHDDILAIRTNEVTHETEILIELE